MILNLLDAASGATVIESKAKTSVSTKAETKETASDTKVVKVSKTKKAAKAKKPDESASDKGKKVKINNG